MACVEFFFLIPYTQYPAFPLACCLRFLFNRFCGRLHHVRAFFAGAEVLASIKALEHFLKLRHDVG